VRQRGRKRGEEEEEEEEEERAGEGGKTDDGLAAVGKTTRTGLEGRAGDGDFCQAALVVVQLAQMLRCWAGSAQLGLAPRFRLWP
jgi:hypothetical protein